MIALYILITIASILLLICLIILLFTLYVHNSYFGKRFTPNPNVVYYTKEEFEHMIAEGELIEWAEYVGNYYGTPKKAVAQQLAEGKDVLLEIEMQGGMLVKEQFPEAVLIFITPPSYDELKSRLQGRGTESAEEIERRLNRAGEEVAYMKSYDYIVVNDELTEAVNRVNNIITDEHYRVSNSMDLIADMDRELGRHAEGE